MHGLIAGVPSRPPNVDRIVELNRRAAGAFPSEPEPLRGDALLSRLGTGATVLDSRVPAGVRPWPHRRVDQPAGVRAGGGHARGLGA